MRDPNLTGAYRTGYSDGRYGYPPLTLTTWLASEKQSYWHGYRDGRERDV